MSSVIKTIWIINQYASTPETGMGGRHYYLAKELAKKGHKVYLIAASYAHTLRNPNCINGAFEKQQVEGINFVWVKVPKYSSSQSPKRIINWFLFSWKVSRLHKYISDSPDSILCSSPSLVSFLGAKCLARRFKCKLLFEVRDIWPLSLVEIGGYKTSHPFIKLLQWIEDKAYSDADYVLSNLRYSVDHMVARGMNPDKFHWIPNGFSLQEVSENQPLGDDILRQLPVDKFIIGYAGSIGKANALHSLLESAKELSHTADIAFVIVGRGTERADLEQYVALHGLKNVTFIDPIPKNQIQSMLSIFDCCYIGLRNDPLFRFGVSPNKLFDYFYSAKPIVYAIDSGEYRPVEEVGAGIQVPPENSASIVKAITSLYEMDQESRIKMGHKGHKFALDHHEYSALADKMNSYL